MPLRPGRYSVDVHHGIDHVSEKTDVEVGDGRGVALHASLAPWVNLRERGLVNGDGHAHLYTDKRPDDEMAARVRRICLAQGVDFIATCQEWSGYVETNWRTGYARFSDDRFLRLFGAEMPKYRAGPTWWLGLTSTRGRFASTMDARHRAFLEELASGRWLDRNGWRLVLKPGQVPWEAFRFDSMRALLADVDRVVALEENERDEAWRRLGESGL